MNVEDVRKEIISEYSRHNINIQVLYQLAYLKYLVQCEIKREEDCKEWKIPYIPSRTKYFNEQEYNDYKKEVDQNGDRNLLVMVNTGKCGVRIKGIQPFARRSVHPMFGTYHLIHRTETGTDILCQENEVEIVKR